MNKTSLDAPITTTVAALSDQRLLQRIKELNAVEQQIEVVVIDHLRELERRHLYLTLGFSSMFDYVVRGLGYSNGAAWRRLKAMRLYEVEGARTLLQEGTLTLDAAAQLQHAFERHERKANRAATPDTEKQAGDRGGTEAGDRPPGVRSGGGPAPDASTRGAGPARSAGASSSSAADAPLRVAELPVARVLDAAERESLVAQAAGKSTRQVKEILAEVDPELARPPDRMRPLGAGRWELKAVIDDDCQVGLEQLKGLLSHVDPQMTLGQLLGRVVRKRWTATIRRGRRAGGAAAAGLPRLPPKLRRRQQRPGRAPLRRSRPACRQAPRLRRRTCRRTPATAALRLRSCRQRPPRPRPSRRRFRRRRRLRRRRGPSCRQARRLRRRGFGQQTGPRQPPESPLRRRRQEAARSLRRIGPSRRRQRRRSRASAAGLFLRR